MPEYGLPYISQNESRADIFEDLLVSFYVLEELWANVTALVNNRYLICLPENYRKFSMCKGLHKKLKTYRKKFHLALARTLRDSLAGMALGEARYMSSENYSGGYYCDQLNHNLSRDVVYNDLNYSLNDIMKLEDMFNCGGWTSGYGGKLWAEVVERVGQYETREAEHYIDTVAHLVHNNGCCFSKSFLVSYRTSGVFIKFLLDQKFEGSLLTLEKGIDSLYDDYTRDLGPLLKLPKSLYAWVMLAADFGLITVADKSQWIVLEGEFNLWQVTWNDQDQLNLEYDEDHQHENSWCGDCDDSYESCGCKPCDCDECQSSWQTVPHNSALAGMPTARVQGLSYRDSAYAY